MATILIVDDRPANRQLMATLLGYAQHQLLEASDGAEALELARTHQPDLIITDILMPNLDGYELAQALRASPNPALARVPIIFSTATYSQRDARALALAAGVRYVLPKPFEPEQLFEITAAALGQAAAPPSAAPLTAPLEQLPRPATVLAGKLAQKMGELDHLSRHLAEIIEMGLALMRERDPERLLQVLCDTARVMTGAGTAAIGMLAADGHSLRHFVSSGLDSATAAAMAATPAGEGLLLQLLAVPRAQRPGASPADKPPTRAFLDLPIASANQIYGRLYVTEKQHAPEFSLQDEQVALALAAQAAMAYENALQYDELQRHTARLQLAVSERRQAQQALQARTDELTAMTQQLWQAAKLATLGELSAGLAHELNNPLFALSLQIEMLQAQLPPHSEHQQRLAVVSGEIERMSKLVASLLQTSRRSARQLAVLDARDELTNTLELLAFHLRQRQIDARTEFGPPLWVQADRQQLRQVFLNLFTNAADAMPHGGTLTVRTWLDAGAPPQAWIEISDTGQGIPAEVLARIWEPFYTTKAEGKGTGLGLGICRRILEEHAGTIEITSAGTPGLGSAVRLSLPGTA